MSGREGLEREIESSREKERNTQEREIKYNLFTPCMTVN